MTTAGSMSDLYDGLYGVSAVDFHHSDLSIIQLLAREVPAASPEPFDAGNFQNLAEGFRCHFTREGGACIFYENGSLIGSRLPFRRKKKRIKGPHHLVAQDLRSIVVT